MRLFCASNMMRLCPGDPIHACTADTGVVWPQAMISPVANVLPSPQRLIRSQGELLSAPVCEHTRRLPTSFAWIAVAQLRSAFTVSVDRPRCWRCLLISSKSAVTGAVLGVGAGVGLGAGTVQGGGAGVGAGVGAGSGRGFVGSPGMLGMPPGRPGIGKGSAAAAWTSLVVSWGSSGTESSGSSAASISSVGVGGGWGLERAWPHAERHRNRQMIVRNDTSLEVD